MKVAETRSVEAWALSDYFLHNKEVGTNLDLIMGAAEAAG
jgi:hypothetical protein